MDAVRDDVEGLITKEVHAANKKFPMFHSNHEGAAVIFEEIQEAEEQMNEVYRTFKILWDLIKHDVESEHCVSVIRESAIKLSVEAIQVAAMAEKFLASAERRVNEDN